MNKLFATAAIAAALPAAAHATVVRSYETIDGRVVSCVISSGITSPKTQGMECRGVDAPIMLKGGRLLSCQDGVECTID